MPGPTLTPVEASKADALRTQAPKPHSHPTMPAAADLFGSAGNMAIQRAAMGPLAGNPAASAILGGANLAGGGCSCGSGTCSECARKPVQRKRDGEARALSPGFHRSVGRSGPGAPLASPARRTMEERFGERFDDVRIHDDGAAADAAREIRAHAFTMGRDVYFGHGRYQPDSSEGQRLLAHELTHVLQQRKGKVQAGLKSLNTSPSDDVHEREAEQVEAQVGREDHGVLAALPSVATGRACAASLQPKCSCGGTCAKCSGQSAAPALPDMSLVAAHPPRRDHAVQRKCECGGTCAKCAGEYADAKKAPVHRQDEDTARSGENVPAQPTKLQRKCSCGATCSKCSGADEESKSPAVQRKVAAGPENARETKPSTPRPGDKPAASGRRSIRGRPAARNGTPGIQSSAISGERRRADRFEREADAAANHVGGAGGPVSSEKISALEGERVQAWEWCVPYVDDDCSITSTAEVVAGEAAEIASEVWEAAQDLADAVGGFLEWVDNLLTITIGPKHVCDAHSIQFTLPELGIDVPFLAGVLPLAPGVMIYGALGLHLGFIPELSLQVGPCNTHTITIALHPISMSGEASGGFDITLAAGLGAIPRASLFGEVGVVIVWPDPPLVLRVPAARIEAGLTGLVRAMLADKFSFDLHVGAGLTGFNYFANVHHNLGFALDLALAGFGSLSVLGVDLCTLYWPLYETHKDTALSFGFGLGLDVSATSFPSLSVDVEPPEFGRMDWADLGIEIQRDTFKDDCPLCDFLYSHGLMPTQRGGGWTGHPKPAWTMGPRRDVYPRDPGIPSESLCRGACGSNCKTCKHDPNHRECVETGDGCHVWWVYPQYELCGSHSGCRNHDACYDWCADKYNEKGTLGLILGPCHRLCDFECMCDYNLPQCVGWIGGGKPHDSQMFFSDKPKMEPGCRGPCPTESKGPGGKVEEKLCLPTIEIIDRQTLFNRIWGRDTGDIVLFSVPLEIPYIPPPTLDIFVCALASASVNAGIGPVTLENVCLIYNPSTNSYSGTGSVHLKGDVGGSLSLTGKVGAKAGWGCLFNVINLEVIRGEVGLTATGRAKAPFDLSLHATVSCKEGKLVLDTAALFQACLDLSFQLDASLRVLLFRRWEIFHQVWNLMDKQWGKCWEFPLGVTSGVIASAACGGRAPSLAPRPMLPSAPPAGPVTPPSGSPPAPAPGTSVPSLGNVENLSLPDLLRDLFKMATGEQIINDKNHGQLPADPAEEAKKPNPCGDVEPDDECGSPQLPMTVVNWTGSDRGEGMVANPLTKCGPQGSDPSIRLPAWACVDAANENNFWVHAHLLHGRSGKNDLHGPGNVANNLILTDKSVNGRMSARVEQDAIRRTHDHDQTLSYRVDALHMANSGDRRYFADGMRITLDRIDPVTRQITENIFNDTIRSKAQRPVPSNCT